MITSNLIGLWPRTYFAQEFRLVLSLTGIRFHGGALRPTWDGLFGHARREIVDGKISAGSSIL